MLDLDGTLVSSFTPKRAPRLPAYVRTHIVGVGSKLNPQVRCMVLLVLQGCPPSGHAEQCSSSCLVRRPQ
jgi:hypothetical protein